MSAGGNVTLSMIEEHAILIYIYIYIVKENECEIDTEIEMIQ